MEYRIEIEPEKINGFTVINKIPIITEEESQKKKQEILYDLYKYFSNQK